MSSNNIDGDSSISHNLPVKFAGNNTDTLASAPDQTPRFVVAIGASAGGLESLERLFRCLRPDTGMSFVVIQHLSPDFKSMMNELLARDTKMPIHRVVDGMTIERNAVYLLPPKKEMIIAGGQLHLTDKDPAKGLALPIDHFFDSLARECGPRAIAVILSGSGSDGSRGIREVARAGGLVISESPDTAKFDSMPLSAQATGLVDAVLSPEEIGTVLAEHAEDQLKLRQGIAQLTQIEAPRGIEAIYELFRSVYDIDFSVYRDTTVLRRINRRLAMTKISTLDAYAERLANDAVELNALYKDLLIGVTQFFRDPAAFELLSNTIVPEIVRHHQDGSPIRVWVAGCATGEEAYSIAILFHECITQSGFAIPLKIFATDVHKASLEFAGRGIYGKETLKEMTPERLARYFTYRDGSYQVSSQVRKSIVFAPHNVLRDAPFTDLDFVSCRNLLIYFQTQAQLRTLTIFHYGLNAGGVMFLGSSESTGDICNELETISETWRIYRKRRDIRLANDLRPALLRPLKDRLPSTSENQHADFRRQTSELHSIHDRLLDQFLPPSLLIDERRALLDSFNGAEKLLRLRPRKPSLDVLDLVDPNLRTTLAGALQRASKDGSTVRFSKVNLRTDTSDSLEQSFNLTVMPIGNSKTHSSHYLISFETIGPSRVIEESTLEDAPSDLESSRDQIRQLEDDLRYSRENLQATIEELETSNEELQATNEELIASNEELQSTNEELHSVNEELYTVNAEHQRKIAELAELNQDMNHLLEHTDVATIFLDSELKIRRFTARAQAIFDIIEQDIGRTIASFSPKIAINELLENLQSVLQSGQPYERETSAVDGTFYLLRAIPFRPNNVVEGVVLMLVDVSSMENLRGRMRWMSAIVESTDDAIIGHDLNGIITSWNRGAERIYGYLPEQAIGRDVSMLVPPERTEEVKHYLTRVLNGDQPLSVDTIRLRQDEREIHVSLTISPVFDAENRVIGVSKIARDISKRIEMVEQLRQQTRQREQFLAILSHELRNPLGAVLNASHVLSDKRISVEIHDQALATIDRQVSMMRTLLLDLLDVSRISQGKIDLKKETIDLNELIDAVRETSRPEVERHGSDLMVELSDSPLLVVGDPVRLVQVQVNLIHNAAKYSAPGMVIRTKLYREGEWAVISVSDQGVGIPADLLARIFEPFIQGDETLDRSDGGLGVGLTLVKSLVEQHGGRVEAHSDGVGKGSTFRVWLPIASTVEEQRSSDDKKSEDVRKQALAWNPTQTCRIVLVEDIDDSRMMLKTILELDGYTVFTANCGETGVKAILEHRPNIALIDIGLPGIDGYEVARQIRNQPAFENAFLVALTGYGQASDVQQAIDAGFDSHLIKPVDPHLLLELIHDRCG